MQEAMLAYFNGEKHGGMMLVAIGLAALIAAAIFWQPRWELRAFAVTLGVVALAELALGIGLYLRTDPPVAALLGKLAADSGAFYSEEVARMARVQRNFVIVQYVEVALIVAGALAALLLKDRNLIAGIALGLTIHAALLLAFDIVAERRGAAYYATLKAG